MSNKFLSTDYNDLISQRWDKNVTVRAADLENGTDYTYNTIIKPWVLKQLANFSQHENAVLDIGSGCGFLTNAMFRSGWTNILGVDISKRSVDYSRIKYPNITFIHQDFYQMIEKKQFDVCVAVMTVNNMPDADLFFKKISRCLRESGRIILMIPHPCFWPIKHIEASDFQYNTEAGYCKKFNTKGRNDYGAKVLFYHRPIEKYLHYLNLYGLKITKFDEITEKEGDKFPDILGIVATKNDFGKVLL